MTRFIDMLESAREAQNHFDVHAVSRAVRALEDRCLARGRLSGEGVWRLHRQEALALEREGGFRPGGGWRAFCSLLVGTGVLKAVEEGFVPGPMATEDWVEDGRACQVRLVESFTRWLIPPSVAAGLFLGMGIHPLWGLRLARRLHMDAPIMEGNVEGWRDEELLPEESLAELRKGIFAALSVLLSGLRKLEPTKRYGLEPLSGFVSEALVYGKAQIEEVGEGLAVLIEDPNGVERAQARSMEFATQEIIEGVLVPAGVMRRYDDDTFAVDPSVLQEVRVGHLGPDAQQTWFQCFLMDVSDTLVA